MTTRDRRRAGRSRHDSVVELFDGSGRLIPGGLRLVDYSRTGGRFTSTRIFARGQRLRARLRLLGEGVIDVFGRVVWIRRVNNAVYYGVAFD